MADRNTKIEWQDCSWRPGTDVSSPPVPGELAQRVVPVHLIKAALSSLRSSPIPQLNALFAAALATIVRLETDKHEARLRVMMKQDPGRILDRVHEIVVPDR